MFHFDLAPVHVFTEVLVNVSILLAAVAAAVKLRVFNILAHRWQSEVKCRHDVLPSGEVTFTADYTVSNTGQRPMAVRTVSLQLVRARREGSLLMPNTESVILERVIRSSQPAYSGLFRIEAGERTIFTLRCIPPELPEVVFVVCSFDLVGNRAPTTFRSMYIRSSRQSRSRRRRVPSPTPALPASLLGISSPGQTVGEETTS